MSSSIADIQEKKDQEIPQLQHRQSEAATTLQRTYRGHKARRQLQGLSLDPTSRWTEAIKEAQYRNLTTPRSRTFPPQSTPGAADDGTPNTPSLAHDLWARAGKIARRANIIEDSSLSSSSSSSADSPASPKHPLTPAQKQAREQKRLAMKQERAKSAKMMDLSYFLEMVDLKHRYGSNLRKYHAEWQARPTRENFFYWLDHGEGLTVDLPHCSRDRLESMQVRYLGREERRLYEVVVGEKGKLVWRKDGVRVDTTLEWRDSVRGIVRVGSDVPEWAHDRPGWARGSSESSGEESGEDVMAGAMWRGDDMPDGATGKEDQKVEQLSKIATTPQQEEPKSPTSEQRDHKRHFSFHDLIRKPTTTGDKKEDGEKAHDTTDGKKKKHKKQMWIFLADTKNNLYIGIKSSGAFQHSSFLHGSRVSAAGTISVRDGQLRILQPRSGHYKTSSHNLRLFIRSLKERGVDMSATAVGGSYAAMVGIEGYMKTKGRIKGLKRGMRELTMREEREEEEKKKEKKGGKGQGGVEKVG